MMLYKYALKLQSHFKASLFVLLEWGWIGKTNRRSQNFDHDFFVELSAILMNFYSEFSKWLVILNFPTAILNY